MGSYIRLYVSRRKAGRDRAFTLRRRLLRTLAGNSGGRSVYDAARHAWRLDRRKAEHTEYVLAHFRGIVQGVFKPVEWKEATAENFPGFPVPEGRIRHGFDGVEAPADVQALYLRKRIPDGYASRQNPIRYVEPAAAEPRRRAA